MLLLLLVGLVAAAPGQLAHGDGMVAAPPVEQVAPLLSLAAEMGNNTLRKPINGSDKTQRNGFLFSVLKNL